MTELLNVTSFVILTYSVYHLLPVIYCRLNKRLAEISEPIRMTEKYDDDFSDRLKSFSLLARWQYLIAKKLKAAGYPSSSAWLIYIAILMGLCLICFLAGLLLGKTATWMILLPLLLISILNQLIGRRIKKRKTAFSKSLYKIYRFLDLQITAGIRTTDALLGLPDAVQDSVVHPVLVRFAASYKLTFNIDSALDIIRMSFSGADCELLATHIRQCVQTGQAGRSLIRMEELLFTRFFSLMQNDTKRLRNQLLLTALFGVIPLIILFLYPLLFGASAAIQSIFR
ncbi:MAG: hypothetical protein VB070_04930 [Clostridiaceae bacterium]|nr:hypothetical protein [Clostridiaceae bacterium]